MEDFLTRVLVEMHATYVVQTLFDYHRIQDSAYMALKWLINNVSSSGKTVSEVGTRKEGSVYAQRRIRA